MSETQYRVTLWIDGRKISEEEVMGNTPRSAFARSKLAKDHSEIYHTWQYRDSPDGSAGFTDPANIANFCDVQPDFSSDPDYGGVPQRAEIICRKKDLNGKGNGTMITRRVRLPDGTTGWASDLAEDVSGSWEQGAYLASQRKCCERGHFPIGTIVLEFESSLRAGTKTGPASIRAGIIVAVKGDRIEWGLSTKGKGKDVQVKTPGGDWVQV